MFALCMLSAYPTCQVGSMVTGVHQSCAHKVSVDPGKTRPAVVCLVIFIGRGLGPGSSWGWLGPELTGTLLVGLQTTCLQARLMPACSTGGPHHDNYIITIANTVFQKPGPHIAIYNVALGH
jgi:hypothetical protein